MRALVAGSTGVIGRQLVPALRDAGHDVVELVRPGHAQGRDRSEVVVADALEAAELTTAVREAAPDAAVNLLTAIPRRVEPRRIARDMAMTNRLRTEATANLIAAAPDARHITEGLAYAYRPLGPPPANGSGPSAPALVDEDQPLWTDGPKPFRPVVQALLEHERLTREAGGVVLRFGHLYGPGSAYAADGSFVEDVRAGKVPLVRGGRAVFSFTHARDAAAAIVAALGTPVTGVLNVVDDDPTPMSVWLPELARILGAPAPKRVPTALARLAAGSWGVAFMTALSGADNRRARRDLDWEPRYASWRDGFEAELATVT